MPALPSLGLTDEQRIAQILTASSFSDARYLLAPRIFPSRPTLIAESFDADAPDPKRELLVELRCANGESSVSAEVIARFLATETQARLEFPRVRARIGPETWGRLSAGSALFSDTAVKELCVGWELATLGGATQNDTKHRISRFIRMMAEIAASLELSVVVIGETSDIARRADVLARAKARFARPVEMRLVSVGRMFPARSVWQAAHALGLRWREPAQLFADEDSNDDAPTTGTLWTLSAPTSPGALLPERVLQGSGCASLSLSFDLPTSPAPIAFYDRCAVVLSYLRQTLGGVPRTADGASLDAERLDNDRDTLEILIVEMTTAGYAPGSESAQRLFL